MGKFCTKCGKFLENDKLFCAACGNRVVNDSTKVNNESESNSNDIKSSLVSLIVLIIFCGVFFTFFNVKGINLKANDSGAINKACTEIKSEVVESFGEVPSVDGKVIYKNDKHYIVAVNFKLSWYEGSYLCDIEGFSKDTYLLKHMTQDMPYNYDYSSQLELLKARWMIE